MDNLNATERAVMCDFMGRLQQHMGNAGCNDYDLPDTDEGHALAKEAEDLDNDDPQVPAPLCTYDFKVLSVLCKKLGWEPTE